MYRAGPISESTVAWLVHCGILSRFAKRSDSETDRRMMVTRVCPISSWGMMPLPMVSVTLRPARIAPANTHSPNRPGIRSFRISLAP